MSQAQHTEIWEKIYGLLRYTKTAKEVHDVVHEHSFNSFNIMMSRCTWGQNDTWNHIYIPSSFRILKENWGSQAILRSYGRLKTVMFFAIFAHKSVLTHAQTFNFDALDLFIARKWLKWQHKQQYKTVAAYFIVSSIPHFRNTCMRIMYQLIIIRLGIVDSHENKWIID